MEYTRSINPPFPTNISKISLSITNQNHYLKDYFYIWIFTPNKTYYYEKIKFNFCPWMA